MSFTLPPYSHHTRRTTIQSDYKDYNYNHPRSPGKKGYWARFAVGFMGGLLVACGVALMGWTPSAHASSVPHQPKRIQDPFAGDTWHAVHGSWPGTMKFDGNTHKVELSPLGSSPINASYTYTVAPVKRAQPGLMTGTLTMTNTIGQTSDATFSITHKKNLELTFKGDVAAEHYLRMTSKEEAVEIKKDQKLFMGIPTVGARE